MDVGKPVSEKATANPGALGTPSAPLVFARASSGLVREFSAWDVFLWVIGAPVASGLMFLPVSTTVQYPGASFPLAFLIGAVIFAVMAALLPIMTAAIPRAGGLYTVVSRVVDPWVAYLGGGFLVVGWGIAVGYLSFVAVGFVGSMFALVGSTQNASALSSIGTWLSTVDGRTIVGVIVVVVFWIVVLLNISWVKQAMRFLTLGAILATIVAIGLFLFHQGASTQQAFDSTWGAGRYEAIMSAATAAGYKAAGFDFGQTIKALLVVAGAYAGLEAISYAGGEIKTPRRSSVIGWRWGYIASAAIFVVIAWAVTFSYGNFIGAYDYLNQLHPDALAKAFPPDASPSIPFYAASLIGNVWLGALIVLLLTFWLLNTMLPFYFGSSRLLFAMSMDRAMPDAISRVSERTASPTWAAHVMLVLSLFGVLAIRNGLIYALGIILFCVFFQWPFYGVAAMSLPFKRKDIYELSPVQSKFMGIPVVSLLGGGVVLLGLFLLLTAISGMDTSAILFLLLITAILVGVGIVQRVRNASAGVDMNAAYAQLPPE